MNLPEHECSLSIEHNKHKDYYQTVEQYLGADHVKDFYDFDTPEDREQCERTNELWVMQWYPNTPIGFNAIGAPTLEKLLDYASRYRADDR